MIVQCTVENVNEIIEYCQQKRLIYLYIQKSGDKFVMDHSLADNVHNEKDKARYISNLEESLVGISNLIDHLNDFKSMLEKTDDFQGISYKIKFDVRGNGSNGKKYILNFDKMAPSRICGSKKPEKIDIDFDKLFTDKLDKVIPNFFIKKTPKKYVPATYKDLCDVLKNN